MDTVVVGNHMNQSPRDVKLVYSCNDSTNLFRCEADEPTAAAKMAMKMKQKAEEEPQQQRTVSSTTHMAQIVRTLFPM